MIPENVRHTLRMSLHRTRVFFRLKQATTDLADDGPPVDWGKHISDVNDAIAWLNAQPQAPEPVRWSHRNGETEAPEVPGMYWFTGTFRIGWAELDENGVEFWLPGHESSFGAESEEWMDGRWYGPIPEPEATE